MGYSAYSKVVFGIEISKDMTFVEKKVRSCNHNVDTNLKFCSECGKPMYTIEREAIVDEGYYEDEIGYFTSSYDSNHIGILGFVIAQTKDQDTSYYAIPEPKEVMIKKLKTFLETHSIEYKLNDLKAYLYTRHSY